MCFVVSQITIMLTSQNTLLFVFDLNSRCLAASQLVQQLEYGLNFQTNFTIFSSPESKAQPRYFNTFHILIDFPIYIDAFKYGIVHFVF